MNAMPPTSYQDIAGAIELAETYAEDGAPHSAADQLVEARNLIDKMLTPAATAPTPAMPLPQFMETVTGALVRRTPAEVAQVPWVAQTISAYAPHINALRELAETTAQRYQAALVDWIEVRQECTCVVTCAEDPASACSLSGKRHVHPLDRHGRFGPCPEHRDAVGDL
ncbi:hypothetical protein ACWDZ4_20050 [Streptomyces sp. NPDC003016]